MKMIKMTKRMRWSSILLGLLVLAFFCILPLFGIEFSSLATFGGLVLAGVSFGARNLIADFLSALILQYDATFVIGDEIHFNDVSGRVQEIGWRDTILVKDGNDISVPNHILTSSIITSKLGKGEHDAGI